MTILGRIACLLAVGALVSGVGPARAGDGSYGFPVFRLGLGPGFYLPAGGETRTDFELDLAVGARVGLGKPFALKPEAGYTYSADDVFGGHRGTLGMAVMVMINDGFGVGWMPRFVIGSSGEGTGIGVRNSLVVDILFAFNIEVSHEWLSVDGHGEHQARLMLGIDFLPVFAAILFANMTD